MAAARLRLRTSEEVIKRLRFEAEWDEGGPFHGEQDLWIGYEDGLYGPMEQRFAAFRSIDEGGDIPLHAIWYFRCGLRIVWDRRRRLDELWHSGDTLSIHAHRRGEKLKGFDASADQVLARTTQDAIEKAAETRAEREELRDIRMAEQQKRKMRQQAQRQREEARGRQVAVAKRGDAPAAQDVPVLASGGSSSAGSSRPGRSSLRVVTWNALCDDFLQEYQGLAEAPPEQRAAGLARTICDADADIVAMQEATAATIAALDAAWEGPRWRTDEAGQLVVWSRLPIARAVSVSLGPNTSKRALLAEVEAGSRAVCVACVHLTSDRRGAELVDNSAKRTGQAAALRAALRGHMAHADALVCGDFNEPGKDGRDAAAASMDGLTDAWLAVHGEGDAGHTFDPQRNRLAGICSLDKTPRRLDRILASAPWIPTEVAVLGEGQLHSDHYGVVASFSQGSRLAEQAPVYTSAAALLPPQAAWPQIDSIRQRFDPAYPRWMPHVNMLYGFVPEELFPEAAAAIEAVVRCHQPIELRLEELTVFEHGRSATLVAVPTQESRGALIALWQGLLELFPTCAERSSHGFEPHLALGKFGSSEEARHWMVELQHDWAPVVFLAEELSLIARAHDGPFGIRRQLPLGSAIGPSDAQFLRSLEVRSGGCRAYALGSTLLLGSLRPPSSDLDVLLVGPRLREEVFGRLESSMRPRWARRGDGPVKVLQMEVEGVHLDIQYACSELAEHPAHWPDSTCAEGGVAAGALRDARVLRSTVMQRCGTVGWRVYQQALVEVKKWARARRIDSNALGYLGGWSWSLLLAETILQEGFEAAANLEAASRQLAGAMYRRFAAWEWPRPVTLQSEPVRPPIQVLMPIMGPTGARVNTARNVTACTLRVLQAELQQAAASATAGATQAAKPPLALFDAFVRCQVVASGPVAGVCASWLQARLLTLIRSLDVLEVRPLQVAPGFWAVGARAADGAELERAASRFRERLERDDPGGLWCNQFEVAVDTREGILSRVRAASGRGSKGVARGGS